MDETDYLVPLADGPARRVVGGRRQNGQCEAMSYLSSLTEREKDRLAAHFQGMANSGKQSENRFKKLEDSGGIWEFRSGSHRLLCFADGRSWVLTHGFVKRGQKAPKREITRAQTIRAEYLELKRASGGL